MGKKIKIIDLLNKIANGEEVPKKIKVGVYEFYICKKHTINNDYDYQNEEGTYLTTYLTEYSYVTSYLNHEAEILDEEDEFEDIEYYDLNNFKYIHRQMKRIIKNQKKIISRLKDE